MEGCLTHVSHEIVCESVMVCRYCKKDLAPCEGVSENWNYVGVIPDKKYFLKEDVETNDFYEWYKR